MVDEKKKQRAGATWTDPVQLMDPADLELLLRTEPRQLLGRIMELNRGPRYHNQLDAFVLMMRVNELRRERDERAPD
ncbi:MAG TPA: hypothetical protein VHL57_12750 [Flavobacteriales bacterium]|jgi:hypothetical protein|nr:hypothetical protein [Flavobacteriales bacterium]